MGSFFQAYYLRLMQEIFAVLTDTMHKPGFRLQVRCATDNLVIILGFSSCLYNCDAIVTKQ